MIDRATMADFLRRRREVLSPTTLDLPGQERRRTPGLRREEVAMLAGISADYYARLEQGRGANPSEGVVTAVARALRLGPDEADYLFLLAGGAPRPRGRGASVDPGLLRTFEQLGDVPAIVFDDLGTVLVQTPLSCALFGGLVPEGGPGRPHDGNAVWAWFAEPELRQLIVEEDWPAHAQGYVAGLRSVCARRGQDPDVRRLVADLLAVSDEFADLWARHDVGNRHVARKRVRHPRVGLVEVDCELLVSADQATTMLVCFPAEGTDSAEKLALLGVLGVLPPVDEALLDPTSACQARSRH